MPELFTGLVTKPGLYPNVPEHLYHRDVTEAGSLSVSGAKLLLPPSCPAVYQWARTHPKHSKAMDKGTVVHGMLLGTGQEVEVIDAGNYRTKASQQARDAATAAGKVPMLAAEHAECEAIAQAVRDDPECGGLLAEGEREVSGFWADPEFGIWCRFRMDSYTMFGDTPTIVDVKTTADSSPEKFARSIAEYRYDMQDWWYRQGVAAILGCQPHDVDFVFVAVPTGEPYLPMAYRLENDADIANAEQDCRIARERWRDCTDAGVWPKWASDITPIELPVYARRRIESNASDYYA